MARWNPNDSLLPIFANIKAGEPLPITVGDLFARAAVLTGEMNKLRGLTKDQKLEVEIIGELFMELSRQKCARVK